MQNRLWWLSLGLLACSCGSKSSTSHFSVPVIGSLDGGPGAWAWSAGRALDADGVPSPPNALLLVFGTGATCATVTRPATGVIHPSRDAVTRLVTFEVALAEGDKQLTGAYPIGNRTSNSPSAPNARRIFVNHYYETVAHGIFYEATSGAVTFTEMPTRIGATGATIAGSIQTTGLTTWDDGSPFDSNADQGSMTGTFTAEYCDALQQDVAAPQ